MKSSRKVQLRNKAHLSAKTKTAYDRPAAAKHGAESGKYILAKRSHPPLLHSKAQLASGLQNLDYGGSSLSTSVRNYFEPKFGYDFSQVRIHDDRNSATLAESMRARAFTTGLNIVFGRQEYQPETTKGKRLIAHELVHIIQQNTGNTDQAHLQYSHPQAGRITPSDQPADYIQRSEASDLIDAHTSWLNLDEPALGAALLQRAQQGDYDFVGRVLDELGSTDRDDVSFEMSKAASDEILLQLATAAAGRRMLDRLYDEITAGSVSEEETQQANRIMQAKAMQISESDFEAGIRAAKIFPYRLPGLTVLDDAPIMAERRSEGRIWVNMPTRVLGTDMFRAETRTLPTEVFISGIELPENEIVGVKMYDLGGEIHYRPALYLVQLANETTTTVYQKMGEAAALGLTLGTGALAGAGARGGATLLARILVWADRVAFALETITSVIREHRGWIISQFGEDGRTFLRYVDIVNSAVAIYGVARFAIGMGQTLNSLRRAYRNWRRAVPSNLSQSERDVVNQISHHTDDVLDRTDEIRRAQRAQPGAEARPASGIGEAEPSAVQGAGRPRAAGEPEAVQPQRRPSQQRSQARVGDVAEVAPEVGRARTTIRHAVCGMCFPAGTKILTHNGHKNIESVGAGDLVLSREDNASGQKSYQRVIQTFQNITTALVEVKVENQCVKSTPGHVWWVKGKGWILADALQAGDEILTSDDALKPIHSVRHVKNFAITYNLEVENFHTYFVAAEDGQAGIWVHNNSVGVRVLRPSQVFQTLIPEIIISDRGAIRQTIGHSLAATGSYSEELRGLYAYLRRGGGAGFQGVTGDAVNRLEVVLRNIQTKGGGVVAAVDLQRIGAGRVYDLSDPAVLRRLMDSYPRFENFFTRLSGEGVVAVRGKIPAKAVQSLVNIPENLSEEARRALLQELVRPCGR